MVRPCSCLDVHDPAAAAVQVAHDVALVFVRGDALDLHDRLEQDRAAFLKASFTAKMAASLERQFVGIDVVVVNRR